MFRFLLAALLLIAPCRAAELRPYREIGRAAVRLSDLFDGIAAGQDRTLGPGPAPGARITVEAPQLAAIARDFGLAWRPLTGSERSVIARAGSPLATETVIAALRAPLAAAGAPPESALSLPGFVAPILPPDAQPMLRIGNATYDPAGQRFTATLRIEAPDMPPVQMRLSGSAEALVPAAMLTHALHVGAVLKEDDLRSGRVRLSALRGRAPAETGALVGLALRNDIAAGQPVTLADTRHPRLIARNAPVRMLLDAGGISLTAQGIALDEGGAGDRVRVQNPVSRAIVIGEIVSAEDVRVLPPRPLLAFAAP